MALWHLDGAIAPQHLRLSGEAALLRRTYDDDDDDENLEERPSTNAQNSRPFGLEWLTASLWYILQRILFFFFFIYLNDTQKVKNR